MSRVSEDFLSAAWGRICDLFHDNFFAMQAVGSVILATGVFWLANIFLLIIDTSIHPLAFWLRKFKIQPNLNVPVDTAKLKKAAKQVLTNQILVYFLFLVLLHPLIVWRGMTASRQLPDFKLALVKLGICVLMEEFGFYYSHRLLHLPRFYRRFHKIHHEWTAPIGIASLYCHPVEFIFSQIGPLYVGAVLAKCHLATTWLWLTIATVQTTISHSGYHFPLLPSPEAHDFHHLKYNQNFGMLGLLDRFHGTDALFRRSRAFSRHVLFFSLTPLAVQIPDDDVDVDDVVDDVDGDARVLRGKGRSSPSPSAPSSSASSSSTTVVTRSRFSQTEMAK